MQAEKKRFETEIEFFMKEIDSLKKEQEIHKSEKAWYDVKLKKIKAKSFENIRKERDKNWKQVADFNTQIDLYQKQLKMY